MHETQGFFQKRIDSTLTLSLSTSLAYPLNPEFTEALDVRTKTF